MRARTYYICSLVLFSSLFLFAFNVPVRAATLSDKEISSYSRDLIFSNTDRKLAAIKKLQAHGKKDVIATLILAMRYIGQAQEIITAVQTITGDDTIKNWEDAMLWQEARPTIVPHESYHDIKLALFRQIDPEFMRFLGQDRAKPENMNIRLEEITWGGVRVDGIPSLDNPKLISGKDATYLKPDDLVFGVSINGDARAYPLRIMGWHEMFNETIGGVPVALAYCTLCGSGILFETEINGQDKPLIFGSSGFLYRSNKLMFDRATDSLWNQFTGEPVSGPLRGKGIKLNIRPVVITTWQDWQKGNPQTKVLSLETGYNRNYGSGVVYREYFASPNLMFPTLVRNEKQVKRKDYVFGIREFGASRAWPLEAFTKASVINDKIGNKNIVLIGNAKTRSVRAYERGSLNFMKTSTPNMLKGSGGTWQVTEDFITSPNGEKLPRISGHISYWFAWDGYLGAKSSLYTP